MHELKDLIIGPMQSQKYEFSGNDKYLKHIYIYIKQEKNITKIYITIQMLQPLLLNYVSHF